MQLEQAGEVVVLISNADLLRAVASIVLGTAVWAALMVLLEGEE